VSSRRWPSLPIPIRGRHRAARLRGHAERQPDDRAPSPGSGTTVRAAHPGGRALGATSPAHRDPRPRHRSCGLPPYDRFRGACRRGGPRPGHAESGLARSGTTVATRDRSGPASTTCPTSSPSSDVDFYARAGSRPHLARQPPHPAVRPARSHQPRSRCDQGHLGVPRDLLPRPVSASERGISAVRCDPTYHRDPCPRMMDSGPGLGHASARCSYRRRERRVDGHG
jgi:hypothetical protein